jgi:hypothetical protein
LHFLSVFKEQKQIYLSYGLVRAYLFLCKNINKSFNQNKNNIIIDNEKKRQIIIGNIFDDLLNELKKSNIILPVKMFLYKNYILQSIFIIFHMIVKLFHKDILVMNNDKSTFYNNLGFIKELSESINSLFFLLGNDILYYLKYPIKIKNNIENNNNDNIYTPGTFPYLRIIDESNPINYNNIMQTKIINPTFRTSRSNTIKFFPSLNNNPLFNLNVNISKENTNSNIIGDSSLFNFSKHSESNISSALFNNINHNNINTNRINIINDENNFNKTGYIIMPTNTFQSNIFRTDAKRKKSPQFSEYFYRYDITPFIDNYKKE